MTMAQQWVQQKAEQQALQHELGAIQQEYNTSTRSSLNCLALFYLIPSSLFVVFLIAVFTISGPWNIPFVGIALLISLLLFGIVYSIFRPIHRGRHSRRFLYTHGLVVVKCRDKQIVASEAIHWREIASIWHHVQFRTKGPSVHMYTLQHSNGSLFGASVDENAELFKAFAIDENVGRVIERMTFPYLWPDALSAYEQGLPIRFGPLTIHTNGIQKQDHFLPWDSFESIIEDNSYGRLLILPKKGQAFSQLEQVWTFVSPKQTFRLADLRPFRPWATIPYAQIPNLALFLRLITAITGHPPP